MEFVKAEDIPFGTWVGFGDDRRYLLAHDDVSGGVFAWFRREGEATRSTTCAPTSR